MSSMTLAESYNESFEYSSSADGQANNHHVTARAADHPEFDIEGTIAVLQRLAARAEAVSEAADKLYNALYDGGR